MAAPKTSVLSPQNKLLVPTWNPVTGVMSTAAPEPEGPAPQGPAPVQEPFLKVPSGEELQQAEFSENFTPTSFGQFTPTSRAEAQQVEQGSVGAVLKQGFYNSLMGTDKLLNLSTSERAKLEAASSSFHRRAPVSGFAIETLAHFVGDSPVDIGVGILSGGFGVVLNMASKANKFKSVAMITRMNNARKTIERVRNGEKISSKLMVNAVADTVEGFITGTVAASISQGLGRGGDMEDIVRSGITDALASPVFGATLRGLGSLTGVSYRTARNKLINNTAQEVQDLYGIPKAKVKETMRKSIPEEEPKIEVEVKQERAQSVILEDATIPPDVDAATPKIPIEALPDSAKVALEQVNIKPSKKNVKRFFDEALQDGQKSDVAMDLIDARVKNTGMTFKSYMEAKGFGAKFGDAASVLIRDNELILNVPRKGLLANDLVHELLHITRSDIGGKHLDTLTAHYGAEPGKPWTVAMEEAYVKDAAKFLSDDAADLPRGLRRAIKATLDWFKDIFRAATGKPGRAAIDEIFTKMFKDGEIDPDLVPTAVKEAQVQAERLSQGIDELRATGEGDLHPDERGGEQAKEAFADDIGQAEAADQQLADEKLADVEAKTEAREKRSEESQAKKDVKAEAKAEKERVKDEAKSKALKKVQDQDRAANAKAKKDADKVAKKEENMKEVRDEIQKSEDAFKDPETNLDSGEIPKTTGVKRTFKFLNALPNDFSFGSVSLMGQMSSLLGKEFKRLTKRFAKDEQLSARLELDGDVAFQAGMSGVSDKRLLGLGKTPNKTKLSAIDKETGETLDLDVNEAQAVIVTMYSRDGTNFDPEAKPNKDGRIPALPNSGQTKLIEKEQGGFEFEGKVYLLDPATLRELQSGSLLDPELEAIVDASIDGYQSYQEIGAKITTANTGKSTFEARNELFTPLATAEPDDPSFSAEMLSSFRDIKAAQGSAAERIGIAPLKLVDPIALWQKYNRTMSHTLSHAETHTLLKNGLKASDLKLRHGFGEKYTDAMNELLASLAGDPKGSRGDSSPLMNKLIAFRQIGILSLRLSTVLKQWGSAWTAAATGIVKDSGFDISKYAFKLWQDKSLFKKTSEEMFAASPMMMLRAKKRTQMIELLDSSSGGELGRLQAARGKDYTIKDLMQMAKENGISKTDAWMETVSKGMKFIEKSDLYMMTSLWHSVKKDHPGESLTEIARIHADLAMKSQPTTDKYSSSLLQQKKGVTAKFLSQFSTQTRKNEEATFNAAITYYNIPKADRTEADGKAFSKVYINMLLGTAYATAMGTIASETQGAALSTLRSEEAQNKIDARRDGIILRTFRRGLTDAVGQIPGGLGVIASATTSKLAGGHVFPIAVPVVSEAITIMEGALELNAKKVLKATSTALGAGQVALPFAELAGRVTE